MFDGLKNIFIKANPGQNAQEKMIVMGQASTDSFARHGLIMAVANQKGGCGKTTTCINLAAGLAKRNFKVLIIDLDPQSHASLGIGIDVYKSPSSIYDVLVKGADLETVIVPTYLENLEIAPATSLLTGAQLEIADLLGREGLLRTSLWRMLNSQARYYDYILLDCSPSLNLLTINALTAAHQVLIPIQAHYFSLEGMRELFSTLKVVKERINVGLEIQGILPTIFDGRTKMSRDVLAQLKEYFNELMLNTVIRMNIALAEASAHGRSIFDFDMSSHGAEDYKSLTEEIIASTRPEFATKSEPAPVDSSQGVPSGGVEAQANG